MTGARYFSSTFRFAALDLGSLTVRLAMAERTRPVASASAAPPGDHRPGAGAGPNRGPGPGGLWPGPWRPCRLLTGHGGLWRWTLPGRGHPGPAPGPEPAGVPGPAAGSLGLAVQVLAPEEEARLSLRGCSPPWTRKMLTPPESWSLTWAAAAPSSPWCGRGRAQVRQPAPGGPDPEPGPPPGRPAGPGESGGPAGEMAGKLYKAAFGTRSSRRTSAAPAWWAPPAP